jgi:hypothetical protein
VLTVSEVKGVELLPAWPRMESFLYCVRPAV